MRSAVIATGWMMLVLAVPALAQPKAPAPAEPQMQQAPTPSAVAPSGPPPADQAQPPATGLFSANELLGQNVTDGTTREIATIKDLVIDESFRISRVMLGTGGLLGIGEKVIAVEMGQLRQDRDGAGALSIELSTEQIEQLPGYQFSDGTWHLLRVSGADDGTGGTGTTTRPPSQ